MAKQKPERQSRMTPEALTELERRYKAGENLDGPFSLKTGKPIKQLTQRAALTAAFAAARDGGK